MIIFLDRNNLVNFIYLLWKRRKSDAYVPFTIVSFLSLFQSSLPFYSVLSSSIFTIQRLRRKFLQCNISLVCSRISLNGICYCLLYWRCFTFRNRSRKSYFHFLLYAHLTFVLPFFFITPLHYLLDNFIHTSFFKLTSWTSSLLKLHLQRAVPLKRVLDVKCYWEILRCLFSIETHRKNIWTFLKRKQFWEQINFNRIFWLN